MSRDNFRIYLDRQGKMPQLRHTAWSSKSHPNYVRYVGNRPVGRHGVDGKIYDYNQQEFVPAESVPVE